MIHHFLIGALLGAPWALAFAPLAHWYLGFAQLLVLLYLVGRTEQVRHAGMLGLGFGWSAYGLGVSWLYISLHTHGGLPGWLAVLAIAAFCLYLALFPAIACVVQARFSDRSGSLWCAVHNALLWAALWTFTEWLRGTFMTGFAWLNLGDALVDSPFSGLLPWLGNYGALFLLLLAFQCAFNVLISPGRLRTAPVLFTVLAVLAVLLSVQPQTRSAGVLNVAGVQTNVDQSIKFDPDRIISNMDKAFQLGDRALATLPEGGLLVFPETVNPLVWTDTPDVWRNRFRDFARPSQTTVLMGSAIQQGNQYFNSIVMLDGSEAGDDLLVPKNRHDKRHLVPFGEFIPLGFAWFVGMLNMPMGEFTSGQEDAQPLLLNGQVLASTVCYEDIFSGEFAGFLKNARTEPTLFVNLSNLAWFGQTWALDQHAQMGRARSAEHRKPGLRVTNTGLSGVVNEFGQWALQVKPGQALVWNSKVEGRLGLTFFARWGSSVWFVIWASVLVLVLVRSRGRRAYNTRNPY